MKRNQCKGHRKHLPSHGSENLAESLLPSLIACCRIMNGQSPYGIRYSCVQWPSFLARNQRIFALLPDRRGSLRNVAWVLTFGVPQRFRGDNGIEHELSELAQKIWDLWSQVSRITEKLAREVYDLVWWLLCEFQITFLRQQVSGLLGTVSYIFGPFQCLVWRVGHSRSLIKVYWMAK